MRRQDEAPLAYAAVVAGMTMNRGPLHRTRTDAAGRFEFPDLLPGEYTVLASGMRGDLGGLIVEGVTVPCEPLSLVVAGHTLRGTIADARGERFHITAVAASWAKESVVETWSGEEGRFVIHGLSLPRGAYAPGDRTRPAMTLPLKGPGAAAVPRCDIATRWRATTCGRRGGT